MQGLREQSFQRNGPLLFNFLPETVRNVTNYTLEEFKFKLDNFLTNVPDEPKIGGIMPGSMESNLRWSNSILDQVAGAS